MKTFKDWLSKENRFFSLMAEETVTYGEVVAVHIGIIVMLMACGIAEFLTR